MPHSSQNHLKIGLNLQDQLLAINSTHLIIGAVEHSSSQMRCERMALRLSNMGIVGSVGLDSYHGIGEGKRLPTPADRPPATL